MTTYGKPLNRYLKSTDVVTEFVKGLVIFGNMYYSDVV